MISPREAIEKAQFFSEDENWGDLDKVSPRLIYILDNYRRFLGHPVYISPVEGAVYDETQSKHSENSFHYCLEDRNPDYALAADIFPDCDLFYAWMMALKMQVGAVGLYAHTFYDAIGTFKDDPHRGSLHLDIRPNKNARYRPLWMRNKDGSYTYLNNQEDFEKVVDTIYRK